MQDVDLFLDRYRMKFELGYVSLVEILSVEECNKYRTLPIVYILYSRGAKVYIGQTTNLASRIQHHKLDKKFTRVLAIHAQNKDEAMYLEFELIRHFKPKHNCNCTQKRVNSSYDRADYIKRQHIGKEKTTLYNSVTTIEY